MTALPLASSLAASLEILRPWSLALVCFAFAPALPGPSALAHLIGAQDQSTLADSHAVSSPHCGKIRLYDEAWPGLNHCRIADTENVLTHITFSINELRDGLRPHSASASSICLLEFRPQQTDQLAFVSDTGRARVLSVEEWQRMFGQKKLTVNWSADR